VSIIGQFNPAEISIAAARMWRKNSHGGRAMPDAVVRGMYEVYKRTRSLELTGRQFNRNAETMGVIFKNHGLPLRSRGGANHKHPREVVVRWYHAYCTFGSAAAVGRLFGKSSGAVVKAFHSHGFQVRPHGGSRRWRPNHQQPIGKAA
jgi:hypothetical protein